MDEAEEASLSSEWGTPPVPVPTGIRGLFLFRSRRRTGTANIRERDADADAPVAPFSDTREPREYQRDALLRWMAGDWRGSVVLPIGAGKTLVALLAIRESPP